MSIFSENIYYREVWADNLEEEMLKIRDIEQSFPYVGLDARFPGIVMIVEKRNMKNSEYSYETLKENVNMLKLIQLGLTFFDENGNLPTCGTDHNCVWQFNFQFDTREDLHTDTIELLSWNGLDLKKCKEKGIDATTFCDQFKSSGVVSPDKNRHWVTFRGRFDFGFLLKILTGANLPETLQEFSEKIKEFFPVFYDIKHVMKYPSKINQLAEDLEVKFYKDQLAADGSLLKSRLFVKLKELHSEKHFEDHAGVLFSLEDD